MDGAFKASQLPMSSFPVCRVSDTCSLNGEQVAIAVSRGAVHCKDLSRHFVNNSMAIFYFFLQPCQSCLVTMSSLMCIAVLNLLDDYVVTYDERKDWSLFP